MNKVVFIFAILWSSFAYSDSIIDIEFKSSGNKIYRTTTLESDIQKNDGFAVNKPRVLLVEVEALNSEKLRRQNNALNDLGHDVENYKLIYVISCKNEEYSDGYHTAKEVASALAGSNDMFRVRLLGAEGVILNQSSQVVSAKEIRRWLEK